MKNSGFMKVFKFSYEQAMKSKSTKITIAIFIVIALLFLPIKTLISEGFEKEETKTWIEKIYIRTDNKEFYNSLLAVVNGELEKEADIVIIAEEEIDAVIEELKAEDSEAVYVEVMLNEDIASEKFGLSYKIVHGNGETAEEKADALSSILVDKSKDIVIGYYAVSEDTSKTLVHSEYETKLFDANGNEIVDDSGLNDKEYWFTYGIILGLIIVTSFIGSMVAEGIVSEKANKVIEYIMITLKPMDLIIGKVLSSMAVLFTMLGSVGVAFVASTFINKAIDSDAENVLQMINGFVKDGTLKGLNIFSFIIVIAVIAAGSYFFSILGGLSGGMVSKVEEMSEGLKIYMVLFMIGAYMAMFMCISANASGTGWGAFSYLVYLLPISSMFIMPSYLLIGKVEMWLGIVALLILIVTAVLLTMLASRIFGQMIYHNGSPLKLTDIISMSKEGKKHEE